MPITLDGSNGITQAGEFNSDSSFGFKNRIINGAMVIDQRNAGSSLTPTNGQYSLDRWKCWQAASSKFSVQQSTTVPTGFRNSIAVTSLSSYSVGADEYFAVEQIIEGFNVADLNWGTANAKTVTLSFQVRSSLTGTFGGAINNGGLSRSYPFSYTISSANTWTTISVTIPGDTTGTWNTNSDGGMRVWFSLGSGSNNVGTANTWASAWYSAPTGSVSVVGTNAASWFLTGVQLEVGNIATSFDYRPYGTELQLCQRYYARVTSTSGNGAVGCGVARSSTASNVYIKLPVTMRTIPTVPSTSTLFLNYNSDVYTAVVSDSGIQGGTDSINFFPNASSASMTTGYSVILAIGSGGHIAFSAEL